MSRGLTQSENHPQKGSSIKVEPVRDLKAIKRIKKYLVEKPRDHCLFSLGINTAYRANELLSIKVADIEHLAVGDVLELKQSKVNKYRGVTLNKNVIDSVSALIASRKYQSDDYLFYSLHGPVLTVPAVNRLVKTWCRENGVKGNFGSHTLRKTWGYQQRIQNNAPIPLLMEAFGHTTQKQTLDYLGVQSHEIQDLYSLEI